MRGYHALDLLREAERHQLRDAQLEAWAESDTEVNTKDLTVWGVYQEILQMAITDTYEVRGDTEGGEGFYKLVFNGEESWGS